MDFFVEPDNIWVAASDGNLSDIKKLIASGIDVNAQDEYGYSPLWENHYVYMNYFFSYYIITDCLSV